MQADVPWPYSQLESWEVMLRQEPETVQVHTWEQLEAVKCHTSPETQRLGLPTGSSWTSRAQASCDPTRFMVKSWQSTQLGSPY